MMRGLILISTLLLFSLQAASGLSCAATNDTATFHCPGSCEEPANFTEYGYSGLNYSVVVPQEDYIPYYSSGYYNYLETRRYYPERELTPLDEIPYDEKFQNKGMRIFVERNRDLPSAKAAKERDRSLCSSATKYHYYPKTSFEKSYVTNTADCYTTNVEEFENYYRVTREGTSEPGGCVKKTRGERISGGKTHFYAKKLRFRVIEFLLSLLS